MSALQPSQVTSRANSDLCRLDIALADPSVPPAVRMARVVAIADEFRTAVAGSTADPLRGAR